LLFSERQRGDSNSGGDDIANLISRHSRRDFKSGNAGSISRWGSFRDPTRPFLGALYQAAGQEQDGESFKAASKEGISSGAE